MKGHTDKSENCKKAGSSSNSKKSKDQKKMGDSKVRHLRKVNSCIKFLETCQSSCFKKCISIYTDLDEDE